MEGGRVCIYTGEPHTVNSEAGFCFTAVVMGDSGGGGSGQSPLVQKVHLANKFIYMDIGIVEVEDI